MAKRFLEVISMGMCAGLLACNGGPGPSPQSPPEPLLLLLDNYGGDAHGGRRIELRFDGSFRNEWYSDVVTNDRDYDEAYTGHFSLDAEQSHLELIPDDGPVEQLYRVDVGDVQFWIHEADRDRITDPDEITLQDESLQVVPPAAK